MGIYKININMIIYGGPYVHQDTGVTTSVTVQPVKHVTSSDRGTQVITIFTTKTTQFELVGYAKALSQTFVLKRYIPVRV